ncbi:MAG TPA: biopolymer transporter ExbD [Planctomycetaceae bacterium]|nr:biopolymer transporter ExbD [Planctomycetaceae bacterium]
MRVPTRPRKQGVSVDITSLIDVIFLLIIFFLAASHFVKSEAREKIDLPAAIEGEDEQNESGGRLIVTISREGSMSVSGRDVTLDEVKQMLFDGFAKDGDKFEVRIRGDKAVSYKQIEPLMIECARSGIVKLKFGVVPGE